MFIKQCNRVWGLRTKMSTKILNPQHFSFLFFLQLWAAYILKSILKMYYFKSTF